MTRRKKPTEQEQEQADLRARHRPDEIPPNQRGPAGSGAGDRHAAGPPMGGSAVGGLGGTNVGNGDPENADIDAAGGSSEFDRELDADQEPGYAGRGGSAVGGTPANKRAVGGHGEQPITTKPARGESTVGRDPHSQG